MALPNARFLPLLLLVFAAIALASSAHSQDRDTARLMRRSEKIANSIRDIQVDESSKIPASIMRKAKGIIVLKQYEAGVIFGAKGGFGIAMKRAADGQWGPPAWIKTGEISGGLQLGAQKLNAVLIIVQEDGLKMLEKANFKIGVDATITSGPTGSNYQANTGVYADILAYTNYEGYYAGATFEGGVLLPDRRANETSYGSRFEVAEILDHPELVAPDYTADIFNLLREIEQETAEE